MHAQTSASTAAALLKEELAVGCSYAGEIDQQIGQQALLSTQEVTNLFCYSIIIECGIIFCGKYSFSIGIYCCMNNSYMYEGTKGWWVTGLV